MNDEDLTRRLEAWAVTTDPTCDPITVADVTDADARVPAVGRWPRRWLAVAALVLAVVGLGAAVLVVRDDGREGVVTDTSDPADDAGTPVQVVLDTTDLVGIPAHQLFRLEPACADPPGCAPAPVAAGPVVAGTSLVFHQALPPGRWTLWYDVGLCVEARCGPVDEDGTPYGESIFDECGVDVEVGRTPVRAVITVTGGIAGGEALACSLHPAEPAPVLTVPPAWSVRDRLPRICPPVDDDGEVSGPTDGRPSVAVQECAVAAWAAGEVGEVATGEADPIGGLRSVWWRLLGEGTERRVAVIRSPSSEGTGAWTTQACGDIDADAGGPADCGPEEPLPLELPPVVSGAPAPTTTDPGAAGTVDVVLDLVSVGEATPAVRGWSITVDGVEVLAGPLSDDGTGYRDAVVQVADDLPVPDGAAVVVSQAGYACPEGCRADGTGPVAGALPAEECPAAAPVERTGSVLVATYDGELCSGAWADAVPALTVPPASSLRTASTACATLAADDLWAECLGQAQRDGETAEWTMRTGDVRTTYLVEAGTVRVIRRRSAEPDGWTIQACGLVDDTECGAEEPMSFDPA